MNHTEHTIQAQAVAWFRYQYPKYRALLFAIPNGAHLAGTAGQRAAQYGRLVREGFVPGVADLFLSIPGADANGLYIEMKSEKGRQSPEQKAFEQSVTQTGYKYTLCRSVEDFQHTIKTYLG